MDEKDFPQNLKDSHKLIKQLLEVIGALVLRTQELSSRVEKLEQENKGLKERLNNNSSNSSQPPSTDKKRRKKEVIPKIRAEATWGIKGILVNYLIAVKLTTL